MRAADGKARSTTFLPLAVVAFFLVNLVLALWGLSARAADSYDGTYKGTFTGTASGTVEFTVAGNQVTVTQPGSGSGTLSGPTISMVVGHAVVGGYTCEYKSGGQLSTDESGNPIASGSWDGTCDYGYSGSGTWQASRDAAGPSPSPSPSNTQSARTVSLNAKPKTLQSPGKTHLIATVDYCERSEPVDFQVRKNGVFQTLESVATDIYCTASVTRKITKKTTFRALIGASDLYTSAESPAVTVKIFGN